MAAVARREAQKQAAAHGGERAVEVTCPNCGTQIIDLMAAVVNHLQRVTTHGGEREALERLAETWRSYARIQRGIAHDHQVLGNTAPAARHEAVADIWDECAAALVAALARAQESP